MDYDECPRLSPRCWNGSGPEFPQPVADRTHDAHFGLSVLRALELANALKSTAPRLGRTAELDFDKALGEADRPPAQEPGERHSRPGGEARGAPRLGASAHPVQRGCTTHDSQHHRHPPSLDLQSQPGLGRHLSRAGPGRGRGGLAGGRPRRVLARASHGGLHLRGHRHRAVRSQAGNREGLSRGHGGRDREGRHPAHLGPESLLPPERLRVGSAWGRGTSSRSDPV